MANQPDITYCSWDGSPAILVRHADGRVEGWTYINAGWRSGNDAEIATQAPVMSKADFRKRFPGVTLPALHDAEGRALN